MRRGVAEASRPTEWRPVILSDLIPEKRDEALKQHSSIELDIRVILSI